jgi:hypothetical protein
LAIIILIKREFNILKIINTDDIDKIKNEFDFVILLYDG